MHKIKMIFDETGGFFRRNWGLVAIYAVSGYSQVVSTPPQPVPLMGGKRANAFAGKTRWKRLEIWHKNGVRKGLRKGTKKKMPDFAAEHLTQK